MRPKLLVLASLVILSPGTSAEPAAKPPAVPKAFEAMKPLIGTWEGTSEVHGKDGPVGVIYALTSGGTAITERLMPDTPHEMISVYYKAGNNVATTVPWATNPSWTLSGPTAKSCSSR